MANILRPPIVFNAPRKYELGTPDPPQRPLTIIPQPAGITLPYQAVRIDFSAPQIKYQPIVDVYPNLSATTLKPAASAYALPLSAERIDWTPPLRKFEVQADNYPAPLTLGINPNAGVLNWSESAPRYPHTPKVDVYPNLSATTLAPVTALNLPLLAVRLDQSAPPPKFQVIAEQYINPVILRPVPKVLQWNDSAPITKYQVIAEQYVNLVVMQPIPKMLGNTDSAPITKYQVQVDAYPNLSQVLSLIPVPNVVGETQAQATTDLSSFTAQIQNAYDPIVIAGTVISQSPTAGSLAAPLSVVIITVSIGPPPAVLETPAGGRRRRKIFVEIDGEVFWVNTEEQAIQLLLQAREMAKKAADLALKRKIVAKAPVADIKAPTIRGAPEIKAAIQEAQTEIRKVYKRASVDYEIYVLMAQKLEAEDIEVLFLL